MDDIKKSSFRVRFCINSIKCCIKISYGIFQKKKKTKKLIPTEECHTNDTPCILFEVIFSTRKVCTNKI